VTGLGLHWTYRMQVPSGDKWRTIECLDRNLMVVVILTAWILWQELQFLDHPGPPAWYLEGRFATETACQEARQTRLIEQLLQQDNGGPTVLNQPTTEQGIIWLRWPTGQEAKMHLVCLPESITPEESWFGHQDLDQPLHASAPLLDDAGGIATQGAGQGGKRSRRLWDVALTPRGYHGEHLPSPQ
jgi:hypothetical protein